MSNRTQDCTVIQGTIESIAFGGSGILRDDKLVIFVPFSAPGDELRVKIIDKRKRFAIGAIDSFISLSSSRTEPQCPHFSTCGGCQFQHIDYASQLEIKKRFISEAFLRIGGLQLPSFDIQGTNDIYGYRRHIRCNFQNTPDGVFLGFYSTDNKTLINLQQCPIFIQEERWIFDKLREFFASLPRTEKYHGQVRIFKSVENVFLLAMDLAFSPPDAFSTQIKNAISTDSRIKAVSIKSPGGKQEFGHNKESMNIHGTSFEYSPFCFVQNHPTQSLEMYAEIERMGSSIKRGKILDLFCGIGISSLLLAKQGHQVVGVEWNSSSVEYAKKNAKNNSISNVRFEAASCENFLKNDQSAWDLVLLNPPRIGISEAVFEALKKRPPKAILYISCMPSTLARDAKAFAQKGYKIDHIRAFDMFPQTTHVETLLLMTKKNT